MKTNTYTIINIHIDAVVRPDGADAHTFINSAFTNRDT